MYYYSTCGSRSTFHPPSTSGIMPHNNIDSRIGIMSPRSMIVVSSELALYGSGEIVPEDRSTVHFACFSFSGRILFDFLSEVVPTYIWTHATTVDQEFESSTFSWSAAVALQYLQNQAPNSGGKIMHKSCTNHFTTDWNTRKNFLFSRWYLSWT